MLECNNTNNIFFSHLTRNDVQTKLLTLSAEQLINDSKENLELFLPNYLLDENNKMLSETYELSVRLIDELKKRFFIKESDKNKLEEPILLRQRSQVCEEKFARTFFKLFKIDIGIGMGKFGASDTEQFFLINLLSIIFLNCFMNFDIIFDIKSKPYMPFDIKSIDESLGLELTIKRPGSLHSLGFFKCDKMKFVDNNYIIDYDYHKLLNDINELILDNTDFNITYNFIIKNGLEIKTNFEDAVDPETFNIDEIRILQKEPIGNIFFKDKYPEIYKEINVRYYNNLLTKQSFVDSIIYNNLKIFEYILSQRPDYVNIVNSNGDTILMLAIEFGNINIIKKTLAQQPNLSIKNKFGKTALMVAIEKGNKEIIEEIKAKLINVI